jgi:hypothetical protein
MEIENAADHSWWKWGRKKRAEMIERDFIQKFDTPVPSKYVWIYGAIALIDSFCYIFWVLAVSLPDPYGITWNTEKGLALRLQLAGETESTMNSGLKQWLKFQLPHQILVGCNL